MRNPSPKSMRRSARTIKESMGLLFAIQNLKERTRWIRAGLHDSITEAIYYLKLMRNKKNGTSHKSNHKQEAIIEKSKRSVHKKVLTKHLRPFDYS